MAKSKEEIINEAKNIVAKIEAFIEKFGGCYPDWYVGITGNKEQRLFVDHNVNRKGYWICCEAYSSDIARIIEDYFIEEHETQGGSGGGNDDSVYVYAYKVTSDTIE